MNKTLLFLLMTLLLYPAVSHAQEDLGDNYYTLSFEDTAMLHHLGIDTVSDPHNTWQVGKPQKTSFTTANTVPNVIVTDTLNSYPVNDTSSFIITNVATGEGWIWPHTAVLAGFYRVNSDTLSDYGTIEFSPDNGLTWIDLLTDTLYASYYDWWMEPVLSGNSGGWQHFEIGLARLGPLFNVQLGDTLLYRFTFISDGVETNKDGLMFDDIHFEDWVEGVDEVTKGDGVTVFPNPTTDRLIIHISDLKPTTASIVNMFGQQIFSLSLSFGKDRGEADVSNLPAGIYFLQLKGEGGNVVKRFVKL